MKIVRGYIYIELNLIGVNNMELDDLNRLLPQVSSSAAPMDIAHIVAMHDAGTRMFAAVYDEHIVAVVLLVHTVIMAGRKDWIEDVVTDEAHRGRGLSARLMDMAERASHESGAKSLNLTSNPERGPARDMYIARGYQLRDTGVFRLSF